MSEKRYFSKDTQQSEKTLKTFKNKNNIALGAVEATENAKKGVCSLQKRAPTLGMPRVQVLVVGG